MISVRSRTREVIFSASAVVARAPRVSAPVRRLIACTVCGQPLEVEVDLDLAKAAGKDLLYALQVYDPGADCQATVRSGLTILTTNRHLGALAPVSRQCRGGIYVGPSPQGVFAAAWSQIVALVTESGPFAVARRQALAQRDDEGARIAKRNIVLPDGLTRIFAPKELQPARPVEPRHLLSVLTQPYVMAQAGQTAADGFTYLLNPDALIDAFGGPWAPERFIASLGGDGGLRGPDFTLPPGLVLRDRDGGDRVTAPLALGALAEAESPGFLKPTPKPRRRVVARSA
jgi:hypothetical protein